MYPTSSRRIRTTRAQESERRVGAAAAEHARELDCVVYGDSVEFRVRHRAGVGAQTKDRSVLARERPGECGAVREVLMEHLVQFRVAESRRPTADRGRSTNCSIVERTPKRVPADHSRRTDDDQPLPLFGQDRHRTTSAI